jgi:hypothetical protein
MADSNILREIANPMESLYENRLRKARLQEYDRLGVARNLAGAALRGDSAARGQLATVDPEMWMALDDRSKAEAAKRLEDVTRTLYGADTPEKWAQAVTYLESQGYELDEGERDFNNREALFERNMSVADQIKQTLDSYRAETGRITARAAEARASRPLPASQMSLTDKVAERKRIAAELGYKEGSAEWRQYVGTGRDSSRHGLLSPKDRELIAEADSKAKEGQISIDLLSSVLAKDPKKGNRSINERAGYGMTAEMQASAARNDPTGFFDDDQGEATSNLSNIVIGQALTTLKATFGAAPTEGERRILIELQASVDKTPAERKQIIDRAIQLAQIRMEYERDLAEAIRSGNYYQPGGAPDIGSYGDGGKQDLQDPAADPAAEDNFNSNVEYHLQRAYEALEAGVPEEEVIQNLIEQGVPEEVLQQIENIQ